MDNLTPEQHVLADIVNNGMSDGHDGQDVLRGDVPDYPTTGYSNEDRAAVADYFSAGAGAEFR